MPIRIPAPCLVLLVGPSGSGKTTWAKEQFEPGQVVSSDELRARVGIDEYDQKASKDAFELLEAIADKRLGRGLVTVIDTLGLNDDQRARHRALADSHGVPCYAVGFDIPAEVCRDRNNHRTRPVPAGVLSGQIRQWKRIRGILADEGFAGVFSPGEVVIVPADQLEAGVHAAAQADDPRPLRFGLQISSFTWQNVAAQAEHLTALAHAAEAAGFTSIWVMDHFRQIPQVGREWHDMLESYTTLGFLAGATSRVRLGALVTGITYRNPALLGKMVATLDVLSGGRAVCGLGIGWFEKEHTAYGWNFPPVAERYALLEDTLQMLPLLWGPGSPSFDGKMISVPEAMCYPRPIQDPVPILVGGSGEQKTLRLVAQYADACNLFGDPDTVARKVGVLYEHCRVVGRDPAAVEVTNLSSVLIAPDRPGLETEVERLRPSNQSRDAFAARVNAGLAEDHIGRFRRYAEAGVQTAIITMPDLTSTDPIASFAEVIAAFR
jgi:F420-dependent oxidoreductase-like protein